MRGELLGSSVEPGLSAMSLQNPKMLRVDLDGEVIARQGAMVAYQGEIDFKYQGSGVKRLLKKMVTGEGLPLMRCEGSGRVFFAREARDIQIIELEGESLTVNGDNVLAFEATLDWDIRRVEGLGVFLGGVFNTVFTGYGALAITCDGPPVVLDPTELPTYVDLGAAVAWTTSLRTSIRNTMGLGTLFGRGSGEKVQIGFSGEGFVVVQPSEGRGESWSSGNSGEEAEEN
ncbi:AIM24 family protein [Carbonactinospora thermoautotrophica]|uniref:AIM24 family protein n=1 Tax=Carbonactinospora thermoautotrophica TaxID=1469144 RepID=A0A132MM39_9ACTN|nr:AIM24 family protein [Carbonactinospora thermoautotrophica]KWW98926.1 hypothetical protein LI90_556 [Carbonactinospora thermoautotrophica]MCX9191501.1 AIM24 family protein [Carbonactinospora thermoautotrophica]